MRDVSTSSSCSWGSPPLNHCAKPQTVPLHKQQFSLYAASGVAHLNIAMLSAGLAHTAQTASTYKL